MKNICDWNNCFEEGNYKAPKERDNSKNFRLLCLEHVKEFNKKWNYFSGMNDRQIMDFLKSDMIWHKPTQSFSSSDNFFKILWNDALKDEMDKLKFNNEFNSKKEYLSALRFSYPCSKSVGNDIDFLFNHLIPIPVCFCLQPYNTLQIKD